MRASENTQLKNIEHPHLIIRNEDWQAYEAHLKLHGGDPKLAFAAKVLSKHPFMVDGQIKTHLACWEEQTVVRERISEKLDLEKVIDPVIQNLLRKRLEECGGDAKKAFGNTVDNPLWFNQAKGIAIHKVRVKARPNILEALHTDSKTGLPVDLVTPGNNHHIAVYQKPSGELTSHLVTFMEAVQRSLEGLPVVDIHPANGDRFIADFSVNKYFLFADTIPEDPKALSDALFRVQKISSLGVGKIYIDFRHHLETDIKRENSFALKRIQSLKNLPHFSVRLSPIGEVLSIQQLHYA
jgi:CRISPR-associated endonuclease Csn1